jgi:hypothetical protein
MATYCYHHLKIFSKTMVCLIRLPRKNKIKKINSTNICCRDISVSDMYMTWNYEYWISSNIIREPWCETNEENASYCVERLFDNTRMQNINQLKQTGNIQETLLFTWLIKWRNIQTISEILHQTLKTFWKFDRYKTYTCNNF